MSEIENLQNLTHQYRSSLEAFANRTAAPTHEIERRGSGSEREQIARIDADLDAVEQRFNLAAAKRAADARIAELEAKLAEPQFRSAPTKLAADDVSSAEYASRWLKAVASGNPAELRVLTTSSTNAGIPTDMERRIIEKRYQSNIIRTLARSSSIDSKRTVTVEGDLPTTSLIAENGAITPVDPTFASAISVVPYKLVCATTMSQEFIEDAIGQGGIGRGLDWVASRIGQSMGLKEEEYMTTGTGSGEPTGIVTNSGTAVDIGAGGAGNSADDDLTADMIIDMVHAVAPQYRAGGRVAFVFHDSMIKKIRKLKDTANRYLWNIADNSGTVLGAPGTILGYPYAISAYMTASSVNTNGAVVGVFGNFDYFEIFDRTGMSSMIDPYSGAGNHRVTLYTYSRFDSKVMLSAAFSRLTV